MKRIEIPGEFNRLKCPWSAQAIRQNFHRLEKVIPGTPPDYLYKFVYPVWIINRNLSKTAEDGDGDVGKTIRLITQDKKRT